MAIFSFRSICMVTLSSLLDRGRHRIFTLSIPSLVPQCSYCTVAALDELGESTIDRRTQRLDLLIEIDGGHRTLGDTLGCELEFLRLH